MRMRAVAADEAQCDFGAADEAKVMLWAEADPSAVNMMDDE